MTSQVHPDDFDVAKAIVAQVKDLSPERRERVFRWVAESIGLPPTSSRPLQIPHIPAALPSSTSADVGAQPVPSTGRDIKTFIAAKTPKGDVQFATAVAYYYRFEAPTGQRREIIDGKILQEATRLAGTKRLSNPRNTLNNAKKSGYLDNASPGEFSINSVGENLVAMALPGGDASRKARRSTRKPGNKKKL
jgi:hypothetical protein